MSKKINRKVSKNTKIPENLKVDEIVSSLNREGVSAEQILLHIWSHQPKLYVNNMKGWVGVLDALECGETKGNIPPKYALKKLMETIELLEDYLQALAEYGKILNSNQHEEPPSNE
jgi:hypothetical protein